MWSLSSPSVRTGCLAKVHLHGALLVWRQVACDLCEVGVCGLHEGLYGVDGEGRDLALQGLCLEGLDDGDEGLGWVLEDGGVLSA